MKIATMFLGEETVKGLVAANKAKKESKKINADANKDSKKKVEEFNEVDLDETATDNKFNYEDGEKEYHDEMEIRNGQEMIKYDREPSKRFKDRAKEGIEGSARMGNKAEKGGNTESTWGASSDDFGKNLVKTIKKADEKRKAAITPMVQFGDDIELLPKGTKTVGQSKKIALESTQPSKRLIFKNPFNGVENAKQLIPEAYRVDNLVIEMTDGDENYVIRWEGTLSEGAPVVLGGYSAEKVNESMDKIKHLFNFKSSIGRPTGEARAKEDAFLKESIARNKKASE